MQRLAKRLNLLLALGTFMVGGYVYHIATNITPSDVHAYHQLQQEVGGFPAYPGDIVAISPDGLRSQRICSVGAGRKFWDNRHIDATYVNSLGRVLPRFQDATAVAAGVFTGVGEAVADSIPFDGHLRSMRDEVLPDSFSPACECAMARRLLQRQKVCTVHGALVERDTELVRAIQFKTYSNFVSKAVLDRCGLAWSGVVEEMGKQLCTTANLPWDAVWRNRLGLIEVQARRPPDDGVEVSAFK